MFPPVTSFASTRKVAIQQTKSNSFLTTHLYNIDKNWFDTTYKALYCNNH